MLVRGRVVAFGLVAFFSAAAVVVGACSIDIVGKGGQSGFDSTPGEGGSVLPPGVLPDGRIIDQDVVTEDCPAVPGRGPKMVKMGSGTGCIDETEVTVGQYMTFFDALQVDASFDAGAACPVQAYGFYAPTPSPGTEGGLPVSAVTWCDAVSFCAWSGKHLCSGSEGGEWLRACSSPDGDAAPTGSCNRGTASVPAVPYGDGSCPAGNAPGAYDMVGSVWEWTTDCDGGGGCTTRGGSFAGATTDDCQSGRGLGTVMTAYDVGFRCCL